MFSTAAPIEKNKVTIKNKFFIVKTPFSYFRVNIPYFREKIVLKGSFV
jgi:hypothetical protein